MKIPSGNSPRSTKNDCAKGFLPTPPPLLDGVLLFLLPLLWVLVVVVWVTSVLSLVNSLVTWSDPVWILSTLGVLIESACSWVLVEYPLAKYSVSAELEPGSNIIALVALVVTLIVLLPVVNKGLPLTFGLGIC